MQRKQLATSKTSHQKSCTRLQELATSNQNGLQAAMPWSQPAYILDADADADVNVDVDVNADADADVDLDCHHQ